MNVAIVVAAGKGTRLGGNRPKQFLELGGVPVIIHTLRQFERSTEIDQIVSVLPPEEVAAFHSLAQQFQIQKFSGAVTGGATRAQSVLCGLSSIGEADIVAIHDGVRPFVTPEEIDATVRAARANGAAILTASVDDTIKEVEGYQILRTLPRANLRRALTPQCFRYDILKRAYNDLSEIEASGLEITDDSILVERLGVEIVTVQGSARNIKITSAEDLTLADALLKNR